MLGIVPVGVVRESRKFRAPLYMAHRAVIFATAQLSCIEYRGVNPAGADVKGPGISARGPPARYH